MSYKAVPVWFRLEDRLYSAGVDEFDNSLGPPQLRVDIREFELEKETPKGVWLRGFMFRRFCLRGARKRFACPTLEQALESFVARKHKQIHIYEKRVASAELAIVYGTQDVLAYGNLKSDKLNDWRIG